MKVSTELKNLIKAEFENKRNAVREKTRLEAEAEYDAVLDKISNDKDFKDMCLASSKFYSRFKDILPKDTYPSKTPFCRSNMFTSIYSLSPSVFVSKSVGSYAKNNTNKHELSDLDKQEQSLLIRLQYERDMDAIKSLLSEYDINIL